jgi:hypothetical protein
MYSSSVSGSLRQTDDLAVTGTRCSEFILRVQPQQRCQLNPFYLVTSNLSNKDSQGRSVGFTRHSQCHPLTPSSNEVESTRLDLDNNCDTSDQSFLWRTQQQPIPFGALFNLWTIYFFNFQILFWPRWTSDNWNHRFIISRYGGVPVFHFRLFGSLNEHFCWDVSTQTCKFNLIAVFSRHRWTKALTAMVCIIPLHCETNTYHNGEGCFVVECMNVLLHPWNERLRWSSG